MIETLNISLLELKDLYIRFKATGYGYIHAVNGVDISVQKGEAIAIVGESGSGKSVTGLSLARLLPEKNCEISLKTLRFENTDIFNLKKDELNALRGSGISYIFQEPVHSLNPVFTIGRQIAETITYHQKISYKNAIEYSKILLQKVGIPAYRINSYPHQISGGMCQRVMIAIAISCGPKILVADEPTTALDVTMQAQILELLYSLRQNLKVALILITHNLSIVSRIVQRIYVMYAGKIMETGDAGSVYERPAHPYTYGLLKCLPGVRKPKQRLESIPGDIPDPLSLPKGCKFHPRCRWAVEKCKVEEPGMLNVSERHYSRCHRWEELVQSV